MKEVKKTRKYEIGDIVYIVVPKDSTSKQKVISSATIFDILENSVDNCTAYFCMPNNKIDFGHAILDEKFIFENKKDAQKFLLWKKNELYF